MPPLFSAPLLAPSHGGPALAVFRQPLLALGEVWQGAFEALPEVRGVMGLVQVDELVWFPYVPSGQFSQISRPAWTAYVPRGQSKQLVWPGLSWYFPALQSSQMLRP